MTSTSIAQQRLMGMAYSLKKGEMDPKDASQEVKDLADSMTLKQLKDFAETKHEGLPDKVEEAKSNVKVISKDAWNKINKDYKAIVDGQKYVMEYDDSRDSTIMVPVIVENITPANIGGMGATLLPTATQLGSGDILSGSGDAEEEFLKRKKERKDYLTKMKRFKTFEQFVNESSGDAVNTFANDEQQEGYDAKVFLGHFDGRSFKAQVCTKLWPDGVPVTKHFSKFQDVKLKGEFQLVDSDRGWWYIQGPKGTWYAVKHADYETPPFEY